MIHFRLVWSDGLETDMYQPLSERITYCHTLMSRAEEITSRYGRRLALTSMEIISVAY